MDVRAFQKSLPKQIFVDLITWTHVFLSVLFILGSEARLSAFFYSSFL